LATDEERGAALLWIAASLVMLLAFSALAVDLAWLYLNSSRLQNAADASALAAVINAPGFMTQAQTDAESAATANGYPVSGANTVTTNLLNDNTVQATLTTSVNTYFLKALGFNRFDVTRTSTAQYVKPVPIGNPDNCFGEAPKPPPGVPCTGGDPNLWAAISGKWTDKFNGDAFATQYWGDPLGGAQPNSQYRPEGYYYGIEVFPGSNHVKVNVFDAGFYERGSFDIETGDHEQDGGGGARTHFQVYYPDTTPLDPTDNRFTVGAVPGCTWDIPSNEVSEHYRWHWRKLCDVNAPGDETPGIYVIQVWTTENIGGTNQYSLHADVSSGPNPVVYAINDMSIFSNQDAATAKLYLAEIAPEHAGKTLELRFYDPGEDDADAYMTVKRPDGSTAECSWFSEDESGFTTTPPGKGGFGDCRIQTSKGSPLFNGQWITAAAEIPADYACDPTQTYDCWWYMDIELNQPHDRTTWTARVIGNPVRLIPNP
jgi:hypothetical protein